MQQIVDSHSASVLSSHGEQNGMGERFVIFPWRK